MMRFFYAPLLVAMMCSAQGLAQNTTVTDGVFAVVNDQVILQSELDQTVAALNARYKATGQQPSHRLQEEAFELLVLRKLQLDVVRRAGLSINEPAIEAQLAQIAKEQGFTTVNALRDALEHEKKGSYSTLRQNLIDEMAVAALQEHELGTRISISEQEITEFLNSPNAQALNQDAYRTWHLRVPYAKDRQLSEQVATQVYQALQSGQHLNDVLTTSHPLQVQGVDSGYNGLMQLPQALQSVIGGLSVGEVVSFATAGGIDVIKLIDRRPAQVLMPQWQVSHILVKTDDPEATTKIAELADALKNGADFASLAKRHSDDTASALNGGDLGWVGEQQMVPVFEEVMKKTPKGTVSAPFASQFGWHILKVNDLRQHDVTDQYKKAAARQILFERRAPKVQEDWLHELKQNAYIHQTNPN